MALPNHKTLYLAGFHDSWNKRAKLKTFTGIPSGAPVVLLAHDPDNFGEAIGAEVNLVLAGHTHGGQIGLSFLSEKSKSANKSSFMSGLFNTGKTKMYVNRGIATTHRAGLGDVRAERAQRLISCKNNETFAQLPWDLGSSKYQSTEKGKSITWGGVLGYALYF